MLIVVVIFDPSKDHSRSFAELKVFKRLTPTTLTTFRLPAAYAHVQGGCWPN